MVKIKRFCISFCLFWNIMFKQQPSLSNGQKYLWGKTLSSELINLSSFTLKRDTQVLTKWFLYFRNLFKGFIQIQLYISSVLEHTFGEMSPDSTSKAFHSKVSTLVQATSSWSSIDPHPQITFLMNHAQAHPFWGLWSCPECIHFLFKSLLPHPVFLFFYLCFLGTFAPFLTETHSPHLSSSLRA